MQLLEQVTKSSSVISSCALRFEHEGAHRPTDKIAIDGIGYEALVSVIRRIPKAGFSDVGTAIVRELNIIVDDETLVSIKVRHDGNAKDLAYGFRDVRICKPVDIAMRIANFHINEALRSGNLTSEREAQLRRNKETNEAVLGGKRLPLSLIL